LKTQIAKNFYYFIVEVHSVQKEYLYVFNGFLIQSQYFNGVLKKHGRSAKKIKTIQAKQIPKITPKNGKTRFR